MAGTRSCESAATQKALLIPSGGTQHAGAMRCPLPPRAICRVLWASQSQRLVHESAFIHAQKLVINNVHRPADERMSKDDVYEVLGIDSLDHQTQEIDIIEMNASNYELVKDIEVKILNHFQMKLRGRAN